MPRLKKTPYIAKPIEPYTYGHAVPKGSKRATYDPQANTYNKRLNNKGYLIAQGIGNITGIPTEYTRAFSVAFSPAFS